VAGCHAATGVRRGAGAPRPRAGAAERARAWAWAGFAEQAKWEARGPVSENNIFQFLFSNKFQTKASTQIFEQENGIF
jgi:hypothetical protein